MSSIGKRIHDRRLQLGLSADELAKRLGKNRATIYRYESDEIENLPVSVMIPLSKVLNVSPAYLMGWEEDNEFSRKYRKKLSEIIEAADLANIQADGIDIDKIQRVIDGDLPLTLDLACAIADEMGISLDELFGRSPHEIIKAALNNEDSLTGEIIKLLLSLPEQKRQEALNYLRYLSETSKNQ